MKKLLQLSLLSALVMGITACGGGSSHTTSNPLATASSTASSVALTTSSVATSSQPAVATTTYTVSVAVPTSFATQAALTTLPQTISQLFIPRAYAEEVAALTAANFAVVIVDLGGNVLERVALADSDISKNSDGSWSIAVPGNPRIDCIIVADVTKPIVLPVAGNINQEGFVFAPTTAETVDIDVGSTAAFKNFIEELGGQGTFASLNIDPTDTQQIKAVENLVNSIQVVVEEQTLTGYSNVTDALAALKTTVKDTVKQEVENVKNPAQGNAVSLIRDEGGAFWFESNDKKIAYGGIVGSEEEVNYSFNGTAFIKNTEATASRQLVLGSNGWQFSADKFKVASFNEDGSVTLQDVAVADAKEIVQVTQVFDLAGRNISQYLAANYTTSSLAKLANPEATFAAGAKGYRIQTRAEAKSYKIYYEPGNSEGVCPWNQNMNANSLGGNCNVVTLQTSGKKSTSSASDSGTTDSASVSSISRSFTSESRASSSKAVTSESRASSSKAVTSESRASSSKAVTSESRASSSKAVTSESRASSSKAVTSESRASSSKAVTSESRASSSKAVTSESRASSSKAVTSESRASSSHASVSEPGTTGLDSTLPTSAALSALFSEDVLPNAAGFVGIDIGVKGDIGTISVQLLNNAAKTERFYLQTWSTGATVLIGEGTWSEFTLSTLAADAQVIQIRIPKEIAAGATLRSGSANFYIIQQAGFLRELRVEEAGVKSEDAGAVFNGTASANILAALDYTPPATLLPTASITLDGSDADWADVRTYLLDPAGDQRERGSASSDLTQVSIAKSGDKLAVLMKVAGDIAFPFAPERDYSNYEVALHFYSNSQCMGEGNGFMVVNNFTSAAGKNTHQLDSHFADSAAATPLSTEVSNAGHVLETSFYFDYLPQNKGDYITLTAVVQAFVGEKAIGYDLNTEQKTCLKIR